MRYRASIIVAAAAVLLAPARMSYAAAYTFNVTVDLAGVAIDAVTVGGNAGSRISFDADFPQIDQFFVTDTLHLNVTFADGALLQLVDSGAPFLGDDERIVGRTILQGHFRASDRHDAYQFTGVQGSLLINPFASDQFPNDLNLTNSEFRFGGVMLDLTFSNPVFDPALPIFAALVGFEFEFWADGVTVEQELPVPEPSALSLTALGLLGLARRRSLRLRVGGGANVPDMTWRRRL
jgi:hypothetical protein